MGEHDCRSFPYGRYQTMIVHCGNLLIFAAPGHSRLYPLGRHYGCQLSGAAGLFQAKGFRADSNALHQLYKRSRHSNCRIRHNEGIAFAGFHRCQGNRLPSAVLYQKGTLHVTEALLCLYAQRYSLSHLRLLRRSRHSSPGHGPYGYLIFFLSKDYL